MSFGKIKKYFLILNKIYVIWYQNDRNNILNLLEIFTERNRHIVSRKSHFIL